MNNKEKTRKEKKPGIRNMSTRSETNPVRSIQRRRIKNFIKKIYRRANKNIK